MESTKLDALVVGTFTGNCDGGTHLNLSFYKDGKKVPLPPTMDMDAVNLKLEECNRKFQEAEFTGPESLESVIPVKGDSRFDVNDFLMKVLFFFYRNKKPVMTAAGLGEVVLILDGLHDETHMIRTMTQYRQKQDAGEPFEPEGIYMSVW